MVYAFGANTDDVGTREPGRERPHSGEDPEVLPTGGALLRHEREGRETM